MASSQSGCQQCSGIRVLTHLLFPLGSLMSQGKESACPWRVEGEAGTKVISSNKDLWLSMVVKIPLQVGPICILLKVPNYRPKCDLGWGLRATQTPEPSAHFWLASHQQTTLHPAL